MQLDLLSCHDIKINYFPGVLFRRSPAWVQWTAETCALHLRATRGQNFYIYLLWNQSLHLNQLSDILLLWKTLMSGQEITPPHGRGDFRGQSFGTGHQGIICRSFVSQRVGDEASSLHGSAVSMLQWIEIWRFWTPVPGFMLHEPTMSGICGLDGHVILLGRDGPFGNGVAMTGYIWPAIISWWPVRVKITSAQTWYSTTVPWKVCKV